MLRPPIPAELWPLYRAELAGSYPMTTTVQILDVEHRIISDVSDLFVDGHVEAEAVEADEEDPDDLLESIGVQQSCQVVLEDPARAFYAGSRTPTDGVDFMRYMLRTGVATKLPSFGWVHHPLFTGPCSKPDRDGVVVSLEAQSSERLALGNHNRNQSFGGLKADAARAMLVATGEDPRYIDFPAGTPKLSKDVQFKRETRAWSKVWRLAQSMSRTAFYDARAVARMVEQSTTSVWLLDGDWVTEPIRQSDDSSRFSNGVRVNARTATKAKTLVDVSEYLPPSNRNSPQGLARRGVPRHELEFLTPSDLESKTEGRKLAKDTLADRASTVQDAEIHCHPIWGLEIGDLLDVDVDGFAGQVRARKWRKPLTHADDMVIGHQTPVLSPTAGLI